MQTRGDGLRCLIVDDNAEFRDVASSALQNGGLIVVGSASTIAEALAMTEDREPDVVVVDIHLGSESGFELAHLLHRSAGTRSTAVVLTSVHSEYEYTEVIDASPVAGFIPKHSLSADSISRLVGAQTRKPLESTARQEGDHC